MADPVYNVLFLCSANSARSIMAEAILNRDGKGRFRAFSAGSRPSGTVAEHALTLLKTLNYDTASFRSKGWDEFARPGAPEMDFIFTVCDEAAGETCPVWPGHPASAHWSVPDPAKATGTHAEVSAAYDDAYRMLATRIGLFINLPLAKLDHVALHKHLTDIGAGRSVSA
ncbi:MAG: arsenate reductase ArsC [Bauldia sp.]